MNDIKRTDRRITRTKKAIRIALAELLCEKDINTITIKDISEKADINRKTFYNYYSGIHQVVDEIENSIINSLESNLNDVDIYEAMKDPLIVFDKLTAIINSDFEFYSHLMKMSSNVSLATKVVDLLKEKTKEKLKKQVDIPETDLQMIIDYSTSGMIRVYQMWFNSNRAIPIEELSNTLGNIMFYGISGFISKP
ncbi:MAG: TetR/AcrR family transcriptional regulator [Ruminococcus sp.]|nr:TetR/AcrR family transcriptional regulator [Ruminococcus sp.]